MPKHLTGWVNKQFGYRRYVLACFGIATLAFGFRVPHEAESWIADEAVLFLWVPVPIRMGLWFSTGVAAILIPFLWDRLEKWGWAAAVVMPAERALSYTWSSLMWAIPGTPGGTYLSISNAVMWAMVTLILIRCAQWPEADPDRLGLTRKNAAR